MSNTTQITKDGIVIGVGAISDRPYYGGGKEAPVFLERVMLYVPAIPGGMLQTFESALRDVTVGTDVEQLYSLSRYKQGMNSEWDVVILEKCVFLPTEEHDRRWHAIRGVVATITGGGAMKLTRTQREFLEEVIAPAIYRYRNTIVSHLYPGLDPTALKGGG